MFGLEKLFNIERSPAILDSADGKASRAGEIVSFNVLGRPIWTGRNYKEFAVHGYQKNVIAHTCIKLISRNAGGVPWGLKKKQTDGKFADVENVDINALLNKPNLQQTWSDFVQSAIAFKLISGNSYIESVVLNGKIKELYSLRPDKMLIIPGRDGLPAGYQYSNGGSKVLWDFNPITGESDILHMKKFNPLNDWYGMSPIEAASYSIDQHNMASSHNQALLQNSATPSGALIYKPGDASSNLTDQQFNDLREELKSRHQGSTNAGRPMLFEGDFSWVEMGKSLKDMDWLKGKDLSAREIGLAYGVPSQVLGIEGGQKYANFEQAILYLWEYGIIPELDDLKQALNSWLIPKMGLGPEFQLDYSLETVSALIPIRERKWAQMTAAVQGGVISRNEAREVMGFEVVEGGDDIYIPAGSLPLDFAMNRDALLDDQPDTTDPDAS